MTKFKIQTNELLAASVFSSDDESRFILNGVNFEIKPDASPLLVSTDGRRLAVIESQCLQEDMQLSPASFVLGREAISAICKFDKSLGKVLGGQLTIEYHPTKRVLIHFAGGKIVTDWEEGAINEGDYPNWRETIPKSEKEAVPDIAVNAEFVSDFVKVAKHLDVEPAMRVNLYSRTTTMEVKLSACPFFYALLMPMRSTPDDTPVWQPEFLALSTPAKAA